MMKKIAASTDVAWGSNVSFHTMNSSTQRENNLEVRDDFSSENLFQ